MAPNHSRQLGRASSSVLAESVHAEDGLAGAIAAESPRLRRHALHLLYNRADADDLVQDCLEAALRNKGALQDRAKLRGWLLSILHNLFRMQLRSDSQRARALQVMEITGSLAASAPSRDHLRARDFACAMGRLSVEHREILLMLNVEGCGYQEAARTLDVPVGTVMSRLARARRRLRALLEGNDSSMW